ncbi:hypothetical protein NLO85_23995 [Pseudomonas savastanoi]|uniref:Uncharacterized protein n=1 Tax=Pseudomonas savastanoi TaxID=29438 RepID=A0AAW5J7R4_PSESS|nr:hypothetical protein [Pseudomonas savastanoi]MCQ3023548.1 hypothetical protein [Pseudomonas savastanoi]
MNQVDYVPNPIQDKIILDITALITSKLLVAEGGWICLHGETLSGLTTILYRLCGKRLFGVQSPWLFKMAALPNLIGVKGALLHAMRLPNDMNGWPSATIIPGFLGDYLMYSQNKVMLIDDFHIVQRLGSADRQQFRNIIQELIRPPYSLIFVLSGNFASLQSMSRDWPSFVAEPMLKIKKFNSSNHVQVFSNEVLEQRAPKLLSLYGHELVSFDNAKDILDLTKGYIGEILMFICLLAREFQAGEFYNAEPGIFDRASSRYRVRHD